jgi:hypothetical protein
MQSVYETKKIIAELKFVKGINLKKIMSTYTISLFTDI